MKNYPITGQYVTIPQLAKLLGLSRIAVYKKVKSGEIKAIRIGRSYAIAKSAVDCLLGEAVDEAGKKEIDSAIKRTVHDFGPTLKLLGRE